MKQALSFQSSAVSSTTLEDLAAVIGKRVALKRCGRRYIGRCPFHSPDKHPSFYLFVGRDGKPRWGCVCGKHGDLWDWLRRMGEPARFSESREEARHRRERARREQHRLRLLCAFRNRFPDMPPEAEMFLELGA